MTLRRTALSLALLTAGVGSVSAAPFTLSINTDWSTNTSLIATIQNGNDGRGIAYDGTNIVIDVVDAGTAEREVHVLSATNGAPLYQLGLTAQDPYDADNDGNTTETFNLNTGTVGPYKLTTSKSGGAYGVYMGNFVGAAARVIVRYDDTTTASANPNAVAVPVDAIGSTAVDIRTLDVIGTGTGARIYAPTSSTNPQNQALREYTTTDGNRWLSSTSTGANTFFPHQAMIVAKDTNSGVDGDVLWVSASGSPVRRYVRSGGVWTYDRKFFPVLLNSTSISGAAGDYVSINGQDVLVVMRGTSTAGEHNKIYFLSGDTGAVIGSVQPALNGTNTNAGNGGIVTVPTDGVSGFVYYVAPDRHTYGRLSYSASGLSVPFVAGDVRINEIATLEPGTDDTEFVELVGTATQNLTGLELVLLNGDIASSGTAYDAIDLGTTGVLNASGFAAVGGASAVATIQDPNGPTTNWIQNGDPDAVVLRNKFDGTIIDAVTYFTQYDTVPGTAEHGGLDTWSREGTGSGHGGDDTFLIQTGYTTSTTSRIDATIGRVPDGYDTGNNLRDFVSIYAGRTTAAANSGVINTALYSEDFGSPSGLDRTWALTFTPLLLETSASAVPASIPNSPDGVTPTEWASVKDSTGGGDQAIVSDYVASDYNVAADFYCGTLGTLVFPEFEVGALVGRLSQGHQSNTTPAYPLVSPYGTLGDSYYAVEINYTSGTVQAVKVDRNVRTNVGSAQSVSTGWHRLGLAMVDGEILFSVDGVNFAQLTGETERAGYAGVAYRESSAGTGTVRNNFDAFAITAGLVPVEVSTFLVD